MWDTNSFDNSGFVTASVTTGDMDPGDIAPIPLPAGLPLLTVGLLGLGALARRKK